MGLQTGTEEEVVSEGRFRQLSVRESMSQRRTITKSRSKRHVKGNTKLLADVSKALG